MSLVQGQIFGFPCVLYAVLGSQGIVVKCTAAIFFPTVDCKRVSMGLTVSRKTAKNLAVRRKNERILTVSRKKNVNRKKI